MRPYEKGSVYKNMLLRNAMARYLSRIDDMDLSHTLFVRED